MKQITTSRLQDFSRILLGLFMVVAGVGHLSYMRKEFQAQVPDWVPMGKDNVVVLSGFVEIGLGLAMLLAKKYKPQTGIILAVFYVLIFPGNIAQYVNSVDAFGLDTDGKRLARLFFQPVLIGWALWSTGVFIYLRNRKKTASGLAR
jgi:uncharacterized membrane protein